MKQILIIIGLLLCLNSNAIIPDSKYVRLPQEVGMMYKELNVVTKDGYRIETWLFRSGQQDAADPESDGNTTMLDVKVDGDRYIYTALDNGWKFTRTIKVSCKDNKITIEDIE